MNFTKEEQRQIYLMQKKDRKNPDRKAIVLSKDGLIEVYGSITRLCDYHKDIKLNTVKSKKFPFFYKGYKFQKFNINNPKQIDNR